MITLGHGCLKKDGLNSWSESGDDFFSGDYHICRVHSCSNLKMYERVKKDSKKP